MSSAAKVSSGPLIPAFTSRQRLTHWLSLGVWAAALTILWSWWLQPKHEIDTFWFTVNSAVLAWVTLMPAYLLFVLGRGRIPNPAISLPPGQRVAMVVTKVPSEPWPMVRETLLAMLGQPYPHDTWLADEDPSANFRITPKASGARPRVPLVVVAPYFLLSLGASMCALMTNSNAVRGYYVFACINATFYALVLVIILAMHRLEGKPGLELTWTRRVFAPLQLGSWTRAIAATAVLFLSFSGILKSGPQGAEFLLIARDRFAQTSDPPKDNQGGANNRVAGDYAKLDLEEIAKALKRPLPEAERQTPNRSSDVSPVWDPDRGLSWNEASIGAIRVKQPEIVPTVGRLDGNESRLTPLPADTNPWPHDFPLEELVAARILAPPETIGQQFRSASIGLPHHHSQHRRLRHRAEHPPMSGIAAAGRAYSRQILTTLGRMISVSSTVRSLTHGNASH